MKHHLVTLSVLSLSLIASSAAPAGEPPEDGVAESMQRTDAARERPSWSLGAGIGFGSYSWGVSRIQWMGSGLGATGIMLTPTASMLLERRVRDGLALVGRASASYAESNGGGAPEDDSGSTAAGASALVGLRWIHGTQAKVQTSVVALVGGSYERLRETHSAAYSHYTGWPVSMRANISSFDAIIGLALEYELVQDLFARLETPLVRARVEWVKHRVEPYNSSTSQVTEATGVGAGLEIAPSLQIRMAF